MSLTLLRFYPEIILTTLVIENLKGYKIRPFFRDCNLVLYYTWALCGTILKLQKSILFSRAAQLIISD